MLGMEVYGESDNFGVKDKEQSTSSTTDQKLLKPGEAIDDRLQLIHLSRSLLKSRPKMTERH